MRHGSPALVCLLLCAVAAASPALPDRLEERDGSGVRIETEPSGADLFIDGIRRGKTPMEIGDLGPGAHRLELLKDGYRKRSETILVRERALLSIYMELRTVRGKVSVTVGPARGNTENESGPFRPVLLVDGVPKEVGVLQLDEGLHTVRARAFGWRDETRSVLVRADETVFLDIELAPAEFKLSALRASRRRFNPWDAGSLGAASFAFDATAKGYARVSIAGEDGVEVFSRELGPFDTWKQEFDWNGRDGAGAPLGDGEYEVTVRAESVPSAGRRSAIEVKRLTVALQSAVGVRPAAIGSGVAGSMYAPQARLLPSASFQLEGSLLFGDSYDGAAGVAPPVALGVRFAGAEGWEAGAAANFIAAAGGETIPSFAASVRRSVFSAREGKPFSAAVALKYGWSAEEGPAPFALERGIEIDAAFEAGAAGDRGFFVGVAPGARWAGNIPDRALPNLVLAAAAGRRSAEYCLALSARTEGDLSAAGAWPTLIGAELRFFPPPSTLVYGVIAGARADGDGAGFFGGVSLGFLF